MQDSDRNLLCNSLALCPLVDNPEAGIAKMREVLDKRRLRGHGLREIITALGESRSSAAADSLYELASDAQTFKQCENNFINAFAVLDTPRTRELLLGFVEPDISGVTLTCQFQCKDLLAKRLAELARHLPEVAAQLKELCERDLPEINRYVLSIIMDQLGTPEALAANLKLIDDTRSSPIPRGLWEQLETAFIERRPYGQSPNVFTAYGRASNELRARLFRMAIEDEKRQKSAFMLLGNIEVWRLEHGRPTGEPRHPDFASGQPWPPKEPDLV